MLVCCVGWIIIGLVGVWSGYEGCLSCITFACCVLQVVWFDLGFGLCGFGFMSLIVCSGLGLGFELRFCWFGFCVGCLGLVVVLGDLCLILVVIRLFGLVVLVGGYFGLGGVGVLFVCLFID